MTDASLAEQFSRASVVVRGTWAGSATEGRVRVEEVLFGEGPGGRRDVKLDLFMSAGARDDRPIPFRPGDAVGYDAENPAPEAIRRLVDWFAAWSEDGPK